jgi:alcohol dehydrogenase class IV
MEPAARPAPLVEWHYPTRIIYGQGSATRIGACCADWRIGNPLVVTDQTLLGTDQITAVLNELRVSFPRLRIFTDVKSNPLVANVDAGVEVFTAGRHDGVIVIGGGSVLDVGKCIGFVAHRGRSLLELGGSEWDWSQLDDGPATPVIALPTTAGTGSEVGRAAVLNEPDATRRAIVFHPALMPEVAILDPNLTVTLPPHLTAATGMDAFVHCFEALCSPAFHPLADGIALQGIALIADSLPRAYASGADISARGHMLVAASMGATAFQKGLGAVHALAHAVGAQYDVHHGLTNAVLVPYVMTANRAAIGDPVRRIGNVLGLPDPSFDGVYRWLLNLRERLNIPNTLAAIGIPDDADAEIIGARAAADPCARENPVPMIVSDFARLFEQALFGDEA